MPPTRRQVLGLATAAAGVALTGCAGDDGGDGTPTEAPAAGETPTETETAEDETPTATPDGDGPTVQVRDHEEYGEILVGPEERTLYMFDNDDQDASESACQDQCLETWPPLTVDGDATAGTAVTAEVDTFERADGSSQVRANGWPLYYYDDDTEPGDVDGQGANDVWWVLDPAGEPVESADDAG